MFLWNLVDMERIKWEGTEALTPGKHTIEFDFSRRTQKACGRALRDIVFGSFLRRELAEFDQDVGQCVIVCQRSDGVVAEQHDA